MVHILRVSLRKKNLLIGGDIGVPLELSNYSFLLWWVEIGGPLEMLLSYIGHILSGNFMSFLKLYCAEMVFFKHLHI